MADEEVEGVVCIAVPLGAGVAVLEDGEEGGHVFGLWGEGYDGGGTAADRGSGAFFHGAG